MAMKPCRECKKEVSTEAKSCPHCGATNPIRKKVSKLAIVGALLVGVIVVAAIAGPGTEKGGMTPGDTIPAVASRLTP